MELAFDDELAVVGVLCSERGLSPKHWTKGYIGYLTVEEIRRFAADDDFAWLQVERSAALRTFRNGEFDAPPHEVPPVLAYTAPIVGLTADARPGLAKVAAESTSHGLIRCACMSGVWCIATHCRYGTEFPHGLQECCSRQTPIGIWSDLERFRP